MKNMNCQSCGDPNHKKDENEEKKDQYKCNGCGSTAQGEAGECCGSKREKVCSCGSGKLSKECCEA